jgi:phytoene dehydrogenase-like protein
MAKKTTRASAFMTTIDCMSNKLVEDGKNPNDYPVVVIGSGIGGLASAVYLSKAGFPGTVIEQHNVPGGYATAFKRGDFNFDVSPSIFGLPEDIYQELGLEGKVERIPLDLTMRIISKDNDITVPKLSPEQFINALKERYPNEKDGISSYFGFCFAVDDEITRFRKEMETDSLHLPSMPQQYPKMWSLRFISLSDLLKKYLKDPMLIKSLNFGICSTLGLPPSQLSGFMGIAWAGEIVKSQYYYFKPRFQNLSDGFVSVIKDNKGALIYGKAVNKILTDNNRVTGVQTDDGKVYPAKIVVSNANAPDTFGKFLSDNEKAQKHMEQLAQYKPGISSFLIWLGLKGEFHGKGSEQIIYIDSEYDIETDFKNYLACNAEKSLISIALYDNYYKGYSKPGTSTLTIFMESGYEPWRRFEKDYFAGNKEEYNREKMRIAQTLIKRVEEKAIPGLSSMIQVMEAATPLTNITYTKNPEGAICGYPPTTNNAFTNRINNSTPVDGLYLSSGWGYNPGSYYGGIMNGRDVCRLVMKDIKNNFRPPVLTIRLKSVD